MLESDGRREDIDIARKVNNQDVPINLGNNQPIKIKNLVKKIHKLTKSKSILKIGAIKNRPNEIWRMQAENRFITRTLEWKSSVKFEQGLIRSINWYKSFIKIYYDNQSAFKNLQ